MKTDNDKKPAIVVILKDQHSNGKIITEIEEISKKLEVPFKTILLLAEDAKVDSIQKIAAGFKKQGCKFFIAATKNANDLAKIIISHARIPTAVLPIKTEAQILSEQYCLSYSCKKTPPENSVANDTSPMIRFITGIMISLALISKEMLYKHYRQKRELI